MKYENKNGKENYVMKFLDGDDLVSNFGIYGRLKLYRMIIIFRGILRSMFFKLI